MAAKKAKKAVKKIAKKIVQRAEKKAKDIKKSVKKAITKSKSKSKKTKAKAKSKKSKSSKEAAESAALNLLTNIQSMVSLVRTDQQAAEQALRDLNLKMEKIISINSDLKQDSFKQRAQAAFDTLPAFKAGEPQPHERDEKTRGVQEED